MKRPAAPCVASSPFSNWENVPDVVVRLILESLEPRGGVRLSAASRGCRAIASRQDVWRYHVLSTWDLEDVVEALEARQRAGKMCISFKALYAKTWLSTRSSKEPSTARETPLEGVFLLAELLDSKGDVLTTATVDLSNDHDLDDLCAPGGGIEIFVPVDKPSDLKGCTMTINILDLARGRTGCVFSYKNLSLDEEQDSDSEDDTDDEDMEITWKARQAELVGGKGSGRQQVWLSESECPPAEYVIYNNCIATWIQHEDGAFDEVCIRWSMPVDYSSIEECEPVDGYFTEYIERMVNEHRAWY